MAVQLDFEINFEKDGKNADRIGVGWARPENNGSRWSLGENSKIELPPLPRTDFHALVITVVPFVHPPQLPKQRIALLAGATCIGKSEIFTQTRLGYPIPESVKDGKESWPLVIEHHDWARPADILGSGDAREIAIAVRSINVFKIDPNINSPLCLPKEKKLEVEQPPIAASALKPEIESVLGISIRDLMLQFESLGQNCEFGLVQRRAGAEPLGLLRFSSTFLHELFRGLDNHFSGVGEPTHVEAQLGKKNSEGHREYMIREANYNLVYHPFVHEDQMEPAALEAREARKLSFLRQKLLEDFAGGEKTFVVKKQDADEAEMFALLLALNQHGPAWLLWVVPTSDPSKYGVVELLPSGILKGYIDRFAPAENAHAFSFDIWLRICANAHFIRQKLTTLTQQASLPEPVVL